MPVRITIFESIKWAIYFTKGGEEVVSVSEAVTKRDTSDIGIGKTMCPISYTVK